MDNYRIRTPLIYFSKHTIWWLSGNTTGDNNIASYALILYYLTMNTESIEHIDGIYFTPREIDVIACILNMRGTKKIAAILSISPRTVETHIQNILLKISCNSQESIKDFIEKSSNYNSIRQYYVSLIYLYEFEKSLRDASKQVLKEPPPKVSIYYFDEVESGILGSNIKRKLSNHLQLLGIDTNLHKIVNIHMIHPGTNKKILLLSSKSLDKLLLDDKNIINTSNSIFLVVDEENTLEKPPLPYPNVINFTENYYNNFSDVIKLIKPGLESFIKPIICKFSTESQAKTALVNMQDDKPIDLSSNRLSLFINQKFAIGLLIFLYGITSVIWLSYNYKYSIISSDKNYWGKDKENSWNLPVPSEHYVDRPALEKSVWDKIKKLKEKNKDIAIVGLHGLGGTGKTTLATKLILYPKKNYNFRGFFPSETIELLQDSYFDLGSKFNLFDKNMSDKKKIEVVRDWLEKQENTFLVYDNVSDMNILEGYLPHKGDIIITSRNYDIPGAIEIDVMEEKEAFKLMENLLANSTFERDKDFTIYLKELVEKMGYLPLALSQAGSYISQNMISIPEYLTLYNNQQELLLSQTNIPSMNTHTPVYITWDMSIQQLKQNPDFEDSMKLLGYISVSGSENIPKKLLALYLYDKMDSESTIKINRYLSLLRNYSLIKLSNNSVSVHRLVHGWINDRQSKEEKLVFLKKAVREIEKFSNLKNEYLDLNLIKSSLPHIEETLNQARIYLDNNRCADFLSNMGDIYIYLKDHNKAITVLELSLKIKESTNHKDQKKISYVLNQLGTTYLAIGNYTKSIEVLKKALAIDKKYFGNNSIETVGTLRHIGNTYRSLGNYNESIKFLHIVLEIEEKYLGTENIKTASTMRDLGATHNAIGNFNISRKLFQKALAIEENHFGKDHLSCAYTMHQLGRTLRSLGSFEKSLELLHKSLLIQRQHFDKDNAEIAYTLRQLGRTYRSLGNYNKSIELLEEALKIEKKYFGADHLYYAYTMHQLGVTYYSIGEYMKSKKLLEQSLKIAEKAVGPENIKIAHTLHHLGKTYRALHEYEKSLIVLDRALKIEKDNLGDQNLRFARTLEQIALTKQSLGNNLESERLFKESAKILSSPS